MSTYQIAPRSNTSSPSALMSMINATFVKAPKIKATVIPADELIQEKRATDWEIANFAFEELTALGYSCEIIYFETRWSGVTYAAVVYRAPDNKWRWFHWKDPKDSGIFGPYPSLKDTVTAVKEEFNSVGIHFRFAGIGTDVVKSGMTDTDYISMVKQWPRPPRRSK